MPMPRRRAPVADVLADLASALRVTDMTWPRNDDDFLDNRALAWSRCRDHLPDWPEPTESVGTTTRPPDSRLRGMEKNSKRSLDLIGRHLPAFLHGLGREFAGVQGSRIYRALQSGEILYRMYCLAKD